MSTFRYHKTRSVPMASSGKRIITASLLLLFTGFMNPVQAAPPNDRAIARKTAPALRFRAKTVDGRMLSSDQLAGRPYIVNFFASWCPPCRKELPEMVALQKKYEASGFTFIGIAFRDNASMYPDFLWEQGITYPVAMSDPALIAEFGRYQQGGIQSIPTTFVVDRGGRVVKVVQGGQSKAALEELIRQAMQQ